MLQYTYHAQTVAECVSEEAIDQYPCDVRRNVGPPYWEQDQSQRGFSSSCHFHTSHCMLYTPLSAWNLRSWRPILPADHRVDNKQTFSKTDELQRGCGRWQQEYIKLHDDILSGKAPKRLAVSVSVEAGNADRRVVQTLN